MLIKLDNTLFNITKDMPFIFFQESDKSIHFEMFNYDMVSCVSHNFKTMNDFQLFLNKLLSNQFTIVYANKHSIFVGFNYQAHFPIVMTEDETDSKEFSSIDYLGKPTLLIPLSIDEIHNQLRLSMNISEF